MSIPKPPKDVRSGVWTTVASLLRIQFFAALLPCLSFLVLLVLVAAYAVNRSTTTPRFEAYVDLVNGPVLLTIFVILAALFANRLLRTLSIKPQTTAFIFGISSFTSTVIFDRLVGPPTTLASTVTYGLLIALPVSAILARHQIRERQKMNFDAAVTALQNTPARADLARNLRENLPESPASVTIWTLERPRGSGSAGQSEPNPTTRYSVLSESRALSGGTIPVIGYRRGDALRSLALTDSTGRAMGLLVIESSISLGGASERFRRLWRPENRDYKLLAERLAAHIRILDLTDDNLQAGAERGRLIEREIWAAEVHDTLAQGYTAILEALHAHDKLLASSNQGKERRERGHLDLIRATAWKNSREARLLIASADTREPDGQDLVQAISSTLNKLRELHNVSVGMSILGQEREIGGDNRHVLQRCALEASTNIARHSEATRADAVISYENTDSVTLEIVDNGVGLDTSEQSLNAPPLGVGGSGLTLMRARVKHAGQPVGVRKDDRTESRIHTCPECHRNSYKARVYQDARPPGAGYVGCTNKSCPVPQKADSLDMVAYFEGFSGAKKLSEAAQTAVEIIAPPEYQEDWNQSFNDADQQPAQDETLLESSYQDTQADCQMPNNAPPDNAPHNTADSPSESPLDGPLDGQPESTLPSPGSPSDNQEPDTQEPVGHSLQNGEADHRIENHVEAEPVAAEPVDEEPTAAGSQADDYELDTRDAVYRTLLQTSAPDPVLVGFMASIGVSDSVMRTASIGISYASDAAEILNDLAVTHGATTLARVPGFHARGARVETELSRADLALVPYHDQRGRIIALEAITIASPTGDSTDPLHRLLGGGPRNRDDRMGGARHMWLPGHPSALEGVTDDILEALRAASSGAMIGAIHGIEVDAAASARAELGDTDVAASKGGLFGGRTLLWIPGSSNRAREAALQNAQSVLADRGAKVRILSRPPTGEDFPGIGTYLSEKPDSHAAYMNLYADAYSTVLPQPERESNSQTKSPKEDKSQEDAQEEKAPPDPYQSFKRAGRRRRPQPRFRSFSAPEILLAVTVFTFILLMSHSLTSYVVAPLASAVETTLAPVLKTAEPTETPTETSGLGIPGEGEGFGTGEAPSEGEKEGASGGASESETHWLMHPEKPTLEEPGQLLPWLLGFVLRPVAGLLGDAIAWVGEPQIRGWSIPPLAGTIGGVVGGVAALVSAYTLRKLRIERYRMEDGRVGDMTVHRTFLGLKKEERRSLPWLPKARKKRTKKRAKGSSNGASNGASNGSSGKQRQEPESTKQTQKNREE